MGGFRIGRRAASHSYPEPGIIGAPGASLASIITYRQGGASSPPVYGTWAEIQAVVAALKGDVIVNVDTTIIGGLAHIPAGTGVTDGMNRATLADSGVSPTGENLQIDDGAQLKNWRRFVGLSVLGAPTTIPSVLCDNDDLFELLSGAQLFTLGGATMPMMSVTSTGAIGPSILMQQGTPGLVDGTGLGIGVIGVGPGTQLLLIGQNALAQVQGLGLDGTVVGTPTSSLNLFLDATYPPAPGFPGFAGAVSIKLIEFAQAMVFNPANLANWSGISPTSVANALDRIAAKIGPIP